jgi:hypothetical protein
MLTVPNTVGSRGEVPNDDVITCGLRLEGVVRKSRF